MVHSTSIWMAALKYLGLEVTLCHERTVEYFLHSSHSITLSLKESTGRHQGLAR